MIGFASAYVNVHHSEHLRGITPVGLQLQQRPGCSDKRGSLYWDCDGLISLISFDGLLVQHSDSAG